MKFTMRIRSLAFALLLVACNLAFASHVAAHLNPSPAGCEWCVCQGQTPAAPLPVDQTVPAEADPGSVPDNSVTLPSPRGHVTCYRSRAPPHFA